MSATRGGWLRRIASGASVAFLDYPKEGTVEPLHMTPRMTEIGSWMLDGPTWATAKDIASGSGVPLGTVQPTLANRFETAGWVESRRSGGTHIREYRLTPEGRKGVCDALGRPYEPVTAEPADDGREADELSDRERARRREAARAAVQDDEDEADQLDRAEAAAALRRMPETSERVWTFAELAEKDPNLAALVREQMRGEGGP